MLVAIFDSFFFFSKIVVVRFGLLVAPSQIGELLLADGFLIQASLILVYLGFQRHDGVFAVGDFSLIGSQLALYLN